MGLMEDKPNIHDPQEWLKETNREWDLFYYGYQRPLFDKIYASTIKDKSIIDQCLNSANIKHNNVLAGDIQKEFKVNDSDALQSVEEELKKHLYNMGEHVNKLDLNGDLWVNYQQATEFNPTHNHSGILSFVIYADIPEEIREEYKNSPSGNTKTRGLIQFTSQFTNELLAFNPSTYTILIFESSHVHQVYPFYSDNTRITIAGNIQHIE
jgi:hypothetical protein